MSSDVDVVLPVPPEPEPVDPGPFAVAAALAAAVANPVVGPFAVSSDVDVVLPVPLEPEPVDPGPFAVAAAVAATGVTNPVVGPFAVSSDVDVVLPVPPEPEPVDPGPFAVGAAARRVSLPTPSSARSPSPATSTSSCRSRPSRSPRIPDRSPSPLPLLRAASRTPSWVPFAVSSDVDVVLPVPPEPEPIDPGPFSVDAPPANPAIAHVVAGPFAVADDIEIVVLPTTPVEVDPGPFAIAAAVVDRPVAHAALGAFAVSSVVPFEHALPPEPEPEPEPVVAAAHPPRQAPEPAKPRSSIIETAMRLDNDQTMLVRMVSLVARIGARAVANVKVEGLDEIPREGPVILAVNHVSNADAVVTGAWLSESLAPADPLARQEGDVRLAGRRLDRRATAGSTRSTAAPPTSRPSGSRTRILDEGHVLFVFPEGTRSPTARSRRPRTASPMLALRTGAPIVPIGDRRPERRLAEGPEAPASRAATSRSGSASRSGSPTSLPPRARTGETAKGLATTDDHGRIAALLPPAPAGRLRRTVSPSTRR